VPPFPGHFKRYRSPESPKLDLPSRPRLASWDRADHLSQRNLALFLDEFEATIAGGDKLTGPLAVQLDVALEPGTPLLVHRDLDNYLTPITTRLKGRDVVSVWGTKVHGTTSTVQVESAVVATDDLGGWSFAQARPVGSATSAAWKKSLHEQIAQEVAEASPGALEMQVSFRVGPGRAWVNLWKQTFDALGPLLGLEDSRNPFHPLDGRIVRLGLHQTLDARMGFDVEVGLWWRPAGGVVDQAPSKLFERSAPAVGVPAPRREVPRPSAAAPEDGATIEFRNDDEGYLAWVVDHPHGYVVNTTRGHSRSYLKLHRAKCRHVRVLQGGYVTWTSGEYVKVCATSRAVLERWARDVAGGELQAGCPCRP
jgi:hypothetical protein